MKKIKIRKNIENYEKLYEDLKIKYQIKEKENQQLKALLKLRDKEIITLKKKLRYEDENINIINTNDNYNEISQKYIQDLIKDEIENIKKEQILYRNKILTSENYELQFLAPKLTTGNNHNFNFTSHKIMKKDIDNDIDKLYFNMKNEIKGKNKFNSYKKSKFDKNCLNGSLDYKYRNIETFTNEDKSLLNSSFNKILRKPKHTYNI